MTNEEAIKQIEYAIIAGNINDVQCGALKMAIEALEKPVVHGHWIIDGHHRICSVCDNYNCLTDKENDKIADDFCPNCGAKMYEEK